MLALILLVQWGATLYWITREARSNRERAEEVLRQIAVAVHDQTQLLTREVQTALETAAFWLARHPGADPMGNPDFAALVELIKTASGGMTEIRLLSKEGRAIEVAAEAALSGALGVDVSDRMYFQAQLDPATRGLYIGAPIISRLTGDAVIPVSYPLAQPVGNIMALFASVRIDRLVPIYEDIRSKPNGTIALVRTDGVILARVPLEPRFLGASIAASDDFQQHFQKKPSGIYVSRPSVLDGVTRLVSYSTLEQYPMTIAVSAGLDDVNQTWVQNRRLILAGGVLLSLLLVAGASMTLFVVGVIRQSEQRLEKIALFDTLTGSLSRHAFDEAALREYTLAVRQARPLTVLMLDIDHFKRVNDTYGHEAGDVVLRRLAQVWAHALRAGDVLGRIGGEEFAVLMPDTDAEAAFAVTQRLLAATRTTVMQVGGHVIRVTTSIGGATVSPFDYTFADVLRRADVALYDAKHGGRNRVVMADSRA